MPEEPCAYILVKQSFKLQIHGLVMVFTAHFSIANCFKSRYMYNMPIDKKILIDPFANKIKYAYAQMHMCNLTLYDVFNE